MASRASAAKVERSHSHDLQPCHSARSQFLRSAQPDFADSPEGRSGPCFAPARGTSAPKTFVYVLRSLADHKRYYTGVTSDPAARLDTHNAGGSRHTASGKPWEIDVLIQFTDERRALAFERYLKSGSGVAFSKRHLR